MASTPHCWHWSAIKTQLVCCEHLPGRVVGGVDDDRLCPRVECCGKLVGIERPIGLVQCDVAGRRPGEDRVRAIVLIKGLEDDDFVAGVDRGQQGRHHGFGGPATDGDMLVRIHWHVVATGELPRDRAPQLGGAPMSPRTD